MQELNKLYAKRQMACMKLEAAESKLLRQAVKAWSSRQGKNARKIRTTDEERQEMVEAAPREPYRKFLQDLVPDDKLPQHRPYLSGLFGKKVDTIEYCKASHTFRTMMHFSST